MAEIGDGNTVHTESYQLYIEKKIGKKRGKGKNIARTISMFKLTRKGELISPTYQESTDEYWKDVMLAGYVASLSGESRHHLMAGWWTVDAGDKHYVSMEITGIIGLFQEQSYLWRNNQEPMLWMDTKKGYSYALQCPHDDYAEMWQTTVTSWAQHHDGKSAQFQELKPPFARPKWWPDGDDWKSLSDHIAKATGPATSEKTSRKGRSRRSVKGGEGNDTGSKTQGGGNATSSRRTRNTAKAELQRRAAVGVEAEEEGTDADGEGETDYEGELASVAPGQDAPGAVTIDVDGEEGAWRESERREHEAGGQDAEVEGEGEREKETQGEGAARRQARPAKVMPTRGVWGGGVGSRRPRPGKIAAVPGPLIKPLAGSRKRKPRRIESSSSDDDDSTAMRVDKGPNGALFSQLPTTTEPLPAQAKAGSSSGGLVVPPTVVPVDWEARRTFATQTAQDRPQEGQDSTMGGQPINDQSDGYETGGVRQETDTQLVRATAPQSTNPIPISSRSTNLTTTPIPSATNNIDCTVARQPPASQSNTDTQIASTHTTSNNGGYDGDASRDGQGLSSTNMESSGSHSLSITGLPGGGVSSGQQANDSASEMLTGVLTQLVAFRGVRASMTDKQYGATFSSTATAGTMPELPTTVTGSNSITVPSATPPVAPTVLTVAPAPRAQPTHPAPPGASARPEAHAPPLATTSSNTGRNSASIGEVQRNLQQTEFEGDDENAGLPHRKAPPGLKLKLTFNRGKDRYCYYCEDGGSIMDCDTCPRGYCYDIIGKSTDTTFQHTSFPESRPCVSVPIEMVEDKRRVFRCPECLSSNRFMVPDYVINRGSRVTRRVSIKTSVALVMYYLYSYQDTARALVKQLHAALAIFEIHVIPVLIKLNQKVQVSHAEVIRHHLLPKAPYHLAVLFLTESDPRGGWWVMSTDERRGAFRADENEFLNYHVESLIYLATDALTARIFPISCGLNMLNEDALGVIFRTLNIGPWESIVLPTALSLLVKNYVCIFPELFVNLYYFGLPLRSSLLRTWAKSEETREHTGFVLMERAAGRNKPLVVSKFEHASTSHPIGVDLPMVPSVCGCWDKSPHHWSLRHSSTNFGEVFSFYISSCCSLELHIAIYADRRTVFNAHGTKIMEEKWDPASERFSFDPLTMVCMKISKSRKGKLAQAERPRHTVPWTEAGVKNGSFGSP